MRTCLGMGMAGGGVRRRPTNFAPVFVYAAVMYHLLFQLLGVPGLFHSIGLLKLGLGEPKSCPVLNH